MNAKRSGEIYVRIISDIEKEEHIHPEIELLYVIDYHADVYIGKEKYELKKEDIILINTNKKHKLYIPKESMVCQIHFSYYELCGHLDSDHILFWCNTLLDSGESYDELKGLLRALLMEMVEGGSGFSYKENGIQFLVVNCLLDNFRIKTISTNAAGELKKDQRLAKIIQYIHVNYMNPISLTEIAEKLYLSPSSLSRFFVKATGESFVDYVKKIRLQKVAEELVYSDLSMTRIAVDNGFSNPSAMNKAFREMYEVTPTEYRSQAQYERRKEYHAGLVTKQKEKLRLLLDQEDTKRSTAGQAVQRIAADITTGKEYDKWENKLINIGSAYALSAADMQKQVLYLKETLNIEYIRIWNIFSERFMIRKEAGQERLNFDRLDSILDFCVNNNIKLFLDMGTRRDTAMLSKGNALYSYEEGMQFDSRDEWESMLERFLKHLLRRYGKHIIGQWVFEFTFFLNSGPYYRAEKYSNQQTWRLGYEIVKKVIPSARVAGPGMLVLEDEDMLEAVISSFFDIQIQPDIFTVFMFPYAEYDENDEVYSKRITDYRFFQRYMAAIKKMLDKLEFQGELYITEWSNSVSNRSFLQDSCYRGTYVLNSVFNTYPFVDAMGFWYASDLINIYYDSADILNGSSGLLTKDGICKPSYYAFLFLNGMGRYLLGNGENYLITANDEHDFYILCYNMAVLFPSYYIGEEEMYEVERLKDVFQNSKPLRLEFVLQQLEPDDEYIVKQKIVNEQKGSVLNQWIEMGCESELLPEDIAYLRQTSVPAVSIRRQRVQNGQLQLNVELQPHEMRWLHIVKAGI
ncbi:MAG: GH39 family glycosyl hydrolase [Lachnospiraceae bacterium]